MNADLWNAICHIIDRLKDHVDLNHIAAMDHVDHLDSVDHIGHVEHIHGSELLGHLHHLRIPDLLAVLNDALLHATPFEMLSLTQHVDLHAIHTDLGVEQLDVEALDHLLQISSDSPRIAAIFEPFRQLLEQNKQEGAATEPAHESVPAGHEPLFGKYGKCSLCACRGYWGSASTTNNICSVCGHSYYDHW